MFQLSGDAAKIIMILDEHSQEEGDLTTEGIQKKLDRISPSFKRQKQKKEYVAKFIKYFKEMRLLENSKDRRTQFTIKHLIKIRAGAQAANRLQASANMKGKKNRVGSGRRSAGAAAAAIVIMFLGADRAEAWSQVDDCNSFGGPPAAVSARCTAYHRMSCYSDAYCGTMIFEDDGIAECPGPTVCTS